MKGIVLECDAKRCVILKPDGTFAKIKNNGYQLGQQISLQPVSKAWLLTAAACFLLLCGGVGSWFVPSGYVYMDINPSLRLAVNGYGQVINAVALNADGEALLEKSEAIKGGVSECMERVVRQCCDQGYITQEGADVEIYVCTEQKHLEDTVQTAAADLEQEQVTVSVYEMSREENQNAIRHKLSPKRLYALKSYTRYLGGTLEENARKLKDKSTEKIMEQVRDHRSSHTGADQAETQNDMPSYVSEKRRKAVADYTACFGGSLEENHLLLRGVSTREIYRLIQEETGE